MAFTDFIDSSPSPSFCERLAAEKKVSVYFVPGIDKNGKKTYAYTVVSSVLHEKFLEALRMGAIPDFAVIVAMGFGDPPEDIREKMKKLYGFEHSSSDNDNYIIHEDAVTSG